MHAWQLMLSSLEIGLYNYCLYKRCCGFQFIVLNLVSQFILNLALSIILHKQQHLVYMFLNELEKSH